MANLERRQRQSARLALYGSLVVLVFILLGLGVVLQRVLRNPARWGEQSLDRHPAVRLLQEYVRIPTTGGNELLGAEFLARKLAQAGIEATVEPLGNGRVNLWAVIEGDDPQALVLHHHIDVWEAGDPDDWLYPPFAAEIDGPWLYGRGAFDMKSYGIAQLQAFLETAALDRPPRRSLILLATSDEENGSTFGTRWVLARHPELTARFWGVLTEGGMVEALNPEDIKYWGIETSQLRLVPAKVCHPSRLRLEQFVEDLAGWQASQTKIRVTAELSSFLASYAPTRAFPRWRNHLGRPEFMLRNRWGLDNLPPFVQPLFRNQTTVWGIEATPGGYTAEIGLLVLPGVDLDEAVAELLPAWVTHGLTLTLGEPLGADHGSQTDHPLFRTAVDSLQNAYPQTTVDQVMLPWTVTDSRYFREAGIPAYGYSPFLFFSTDTMRVDRVNERIPLPGFVSGVELYSELVRSLVAGPSD